MKVIILLSVFVFSFSSFAYVQHCDNYAPRDEVSFSYNNCIERNFNSFERPMNIIFDRCYSFGGRDNQYFIQCINRNFNRAGIELNVYIQRCDNWHIGRPRYPHSLSRNFQDCVNRNFRQVDYLLNRKP